MKSTKKRIIIVFAILTMALVLSCAFVACDKTDTPDAPKKEFTITFDTQGGSEVKPITIAEGATITLPRNPTKEGFIFDGWYLSNALVEEFNITKTITGDITLYAKWIEDNGSEGLEYSLNSDGNGYTVTSIGTCTDKELIIPFEYKAKPVTSIGNYAFRYCTGLTSVTIGGSVTSIGNEAFYNCTGLTSITIGGSVISIGDDAFRGCTGLTSVTIPDSVTSIGWRAFYDCIGLTSVTIPDSVTWIDSWAFSSCTGLTSVTIGNRVWSIGDGAFDGCTGLTTVNWNATSTSVAPYSPIFKGCSNLATVNIGDNVKIIPSHVFCYCTGLTSVTIPDSVTSIDDGAFRGCTGLTSVTIGNSVMSIGENAFYNCTGLTSVTIGGSVTSIGDWAFDGCTGLTSITFNGTMGQWYAISKGYDWKDSVPSACKVVCTNGTVSI